MNIKSLLLGSVGGVVAITGAQAADAIVIAEPEPMEYVRICDAYGAGYFYIPGTETCLRVSGWVRYQVDGTPSRDYTLTTTPAGGAAATVSGSGNIGLLAGTGAVIGESDGWNKYTGAQINFDARSETEYGTLRGWVQLETGPGTAGGQNRSASTDVDIAINRAVIQLGGLWMAYADSLFSSSSNIGGSSLGNYGGFTYADTFGYHYEQRHQIGYQFSGSNGFWGALSLEHDSNEDYMPDVVGKVAWSQGWGGVWLAAAYDESAEGVGIRGGVQGNFGALTARLDGYYQSNELVSYGRGAEWAIQGTALYQINPKFGIAAGLEYRDNLVFAPASLGAPAADVAYGGHGWAAQIGMNWQPVQNFQVGADVIYNKEEVSYTDAAGTTYDLDQDNTTFRLRFQRNI